MGKTVRETTIAGKTILRNLKISSGNHRGKRKEKKMISKESVKKNNYRLAICNLTILLNANFYESSAHFTLTYAGEAPSKKEATNKMKNFLRKLRRKFKKKNADLKYIAVTEYENKRIHHHVVMNTTDTDLIKTTWDCGFVHSTPLDNTGNYKKLAEYLIKETEKSFRNNDSVSKQRYSPSRNLYRPITKREYVSDKELFEDPKPLEGYYIPKDEIRRFEHPVTELPHLEYIMIAEDKPRRYKTWPRGKAVKIREWFKVNHVEEQERWEWEF